MRRQAEVARRRRARNVARFVVDSAETARGSGTRDMRRRVYSGNLSEKRLRFRHRNQAALAVPRMVTVTSRSIPLGTPRVELRLST